MKGRNFCLATFLVIVLCGISIPNLPADTSKKYLILSCDVLNDGTTSVAATNTPFELQMIVGVGENCAEALGMLVSLGFEIESTQSNEKFLIYTLSALGFCGDDVAEGGEFCDGTDLAGQTCESFGFDDGTLACGDDCFSFDLSACSSTVAECQAGDTVTISGISYDIDLDGLQILGADPNLTAGGFQPFTIETCDWTFGDSLLNIFLTGVADPQTNGWDEEHVIPSQDRTDGDSATPRLDHLELAIDHVDTIGELTGDDKTLFNSDDQGGLTFALRIYDMEGALADCIAWGHDVAGMFGGQVSSYNTHTNQSEISSANCENLSQ